MSSRDLSEENAREVGPLSLYADTYVELRTYASLAVNSVVGRDSDDRVLVDAQLMEQELQSA
jgi:hypothetical protein